MRPKNYLFSCSVAFLAFQYSIWSQERENPVIAVLKCPDRVHAVAFSPDDRVLAAGIGWGTKGGARIWSLPSNKIVADITSGTGDDATVEAIAFSDDGKLFAMADWAGNVTVWDTGKWRLVRIAAKNQKDTKAVSFSHDSLRLLITTQKALVVVDLRNRAIRVLEHRRFDEGDYVDGRFADDNSRIVVSDSKSTRVLDVESKSEVKSWKADNVFFGKLSDDSYLIFWRRCDVRAEAVGDIGSANR